MNEFEQALKLHQQGHLAEAKVHYRNVLQHAPDHASALHLLGLVEFQQHNHAEAERLIVAAIRIQDDIPDYYFNYGLILSDTGRYAEAEQALRQSLRLRPHDTGALSALGNALYASEKHVEAEEACRQAHVLAPDDAHICLGLANALIAQQRLDEAKSVLEKALLLQPQYAEALGNLGAVVRRQGQLPQAEIYLRKALQCNPHYAEALSNLGAVLLDQGQPEEAEASLRAAIEVRPAYASAYSNLGNVLMIQRRIAEAEAAYSKAVELSPEFPDARWNRSLAYLLAGDFANGWREYEWRLKRPDTRRLYPDFPQPEWQGEALDGRRILLYAEQGLGDTLQFIRFVPLVAARGGRVVVRCQAALVRLLRNMPGVDSVIAEGDSLPVFDVQCALLSLPCKLGLDHVQKIPADVPYLGAEPYLANLWGNKLIAGDHLKVGLVWAGAPRKNDLDAHLIDRRRSIALAALERLLAVPGVDFYSLQKGGSKPESAAYRGKMIDLMDEVTDFADTAALVSHLDLIISVDTAVAHLAGAMGKPVWLLSRFDGCWRWLLERDDSPWYPSMRLFRQQQPGDWMPVIGKVTAALQAMLADQAHRDKVQQSMLCLVAGRMDEARAILQPVLEQASDCALAQHALGLVELKAGNVQEAIRRLEQAVTNSPGSVEILSALGDAYRQIGKIDEATRTLGQAIDRDPANAEAHNNLGAVYLAGKRLPQAIDAFSNAIRSKPELVMAHFNMGVAYRELNWMEEAAAAFQRAIDLSPDFAEAHVALGMAWLLTGRLREGFAEYEWRLRLRPPRHQGPQWDGLIAPGSTLLVHFEQGYGDAIQFVRYLPFIARQGVQVAVQCPSGLHALMRGVGGVSAVCGFDDTLPHYDAHCALLSLPRLFQTTLDQIPANVPYLTVSADKSAVWQETLFGYSDKIKVGLCWQGNASYGADSDRSIELALFGKLADMSGVTWISLQNRMFNEHELSVAEHIGLVDVSDRLPDFTDTAALIGQLDLIISVDTAVAHLAGALGRPVWTLLRHAPDWRWMLEREDTPWYPSMRLFRQREPGNWKEVLVEVDATLREVMRSVLGQPGNPPA
ncbi:MAG TPA: tetratricopeptide repeat protein [Novimethylophilus sp.]|uniref:tetratricopeptide repeat protein n=1 Tax=Novimethylophilus sp. TaxID=2137426 RepID=UPI002F41EE98